MMHSKWIVSGVLVGLVFFATIAFAGENLVKNPGFEAISTDLNKPDSWGTENWKGEAIYKYDKAIAHTGAHSVYLECQPDVVGVWGQWLQRVNPSKTYRASVWLKGENLALHSGLYVDNGKVAGNRPVSTVTGTFDWKEVTISGIVPDPAKKNILIFSIVNRGGKLWADDAELCEEVIQSKQEIPAMKSIKQPVAGEQKPGENLGMCRQVLKSDGFRFAFLCAFPLLSNLL